MSAAASKRRFFSHVFMQAVLSPWEIRFISHTAALFWNFLVKGFFFFLLLIFKKEKWERNQKRRRTRLMSCTLYYSIQTSVGADTQKDWAAVIPAFIFYFILFIFFFFRFLWIFVCLFLFFWHNLFNWRNGVRRIIWQGTSPSLWFFYEIYTCEIVEKKRPPCIYVIHIRYIINIPAITRREEEEEEFSAAAAVVWI